MTFPAGQARPTDPEVLQAAVALGPQIQALSREIEAGRRLPQPLIKAMEEAGIFGMTMPKAWGGPQLDPLTQFRVIEALAMEDGSVGWCAMVNCDGGYLTAFLDDSVGRAMFPDIQVGTASCVSITGQAVRVPGGYRVSGSFPFASGCLHSEWVSLGCAVIDDGEPRMDHNGAPETRHCFLRVSQCEIMDTWHTTGLSGTGSNDLRVDDVFVAEHHTFSFLDPALIKRPDPLYAFPFLFTVKVAAPALGVARHAVDALVGMVANKPARRHMIDGHPELPKMMRDDVFVQDAVGRAETMLGAARAYQFEAMGDFWAALVEGRQPTAAQLARLRTIAPYVLRICADVVELVCKTAGGTAIYRKGPFDRCLRDILTMNQHVVASPRTYEAAGRLLLGLAPLRPLY